MASDRPPYLGFGLGLRPQHYREILGRSPAIDWFEIISENYMIPGGQPLHMLDQIAERYPLVMHGVSLSFASTAPLDLEYLAALKRLAERDQAQVDLRSFVLDRRAWCESARSSPRPLHAGGARTSSNAWARCRTFSAAG